LTGKLKTARKGVGGYSIFVEGKAAHAGVDFPNGASAILEAARQVMEIAEFTDLDRGITVNPGLISGGTRTNVIAAQARVDVDIRIARLGDALVLDEKFRALQPVDKRCTIRVQGGLNRPPMERTPAIEALFLEARELGARMGVVVEESSTGGGSDGNFTAALGVPTLDGLGAVGRRACGKRKHPTRSNRRPRRAAGRFGRRRSSLKAWRRALGFRSNSTFALRWTGNVNCWMESCGRNRWVL
jgi:glutamate carboxypeptidase